MIRVISALILFLLIPVGAISQVFFLPTGANRPDVDWHQIETTHFTIIYHDGLESAAREAADIAEAVYPVVTGNLQTEVPGRTPIYLSDLDEVANAFAYDDSFVFIWMRGILDDMAFGGVRSAGRAKWLRAVITHEFTHIVIARATGTTLGDIIPIFALGVPRWFNEGTARFMEPDGWTSDLDMVLRVAAVNGGLRYDMLEDPDRIDGILLYETGHSMVRYMVQRFGDTVIPRILKLGGEGLVFDFNEGVQEATGMSMEDIYADWFRSVTALYGAEYASREEVDDIAPAITREFRAVTGIRYSPDRRWMALLAGDIGLTPESKGQRLYLLSTDSAASPERVVDEPGIDDEFSWSPDGKHIALSKLRYGLHRGLLHDLYIFDVAEGDFRRLTNSASLSDPVWSPDGRTIVAVEKRIGRDNLVAVDPSSGAVRRLTSFTEDRQIYTPSWSPDGARIAFSLFDEHGRRAIATINSDGTGLQLLTADSANNRYPVWSPDGGRIAFTSHAGGIPNLQMMNADGSDRHYLTDIAGGIYSVQWLPGADSIVAISLDTRSRIAPHLIPASRRVEFTPLPLVKQKHVAWRDAAFARQVPEREEMPRAEVSGEEAYSSLLALRPMLPLLPQASEDLGRDGRRGTRLGLTTLWTDPMGKHLILASADYGAASQVAGGEVYYINNQLPISLSFHGDFTLGQEAYVGEQRYAYYQRNRNISLEAGYTLPAPNTLTMSHQFWGGLGLRNLEPWAIRNNSPSVGGTVSSIDQMLLEPFRAKLVELNAGYRFTSRKFFLQGSYLRSEPGLGSERDYHQARLLTSLRLPLFGSENFALLGHFSGVAHWGEQLPQEPVGLENHQRFRNAWLGLTEIARGEGNLSMRGVDVVRYGDRALVASLGLQTRLTFLEEMLPLLRAFRPQTVLFAETGAAWNSATTPLGKVPFISSAGAELRIGGVQNVWLSFGVASGFGEFNQGPKLYIRFQFGL